LKSPKTGRLRDTHSEGKVTGILGDLWEFNPLTHQWTWVGGSSLVAQTAVYGTSGVASSANDPGNRYSATGWTDKDGSFWLFGGTDSNYNDYNDLWKFDPSVNEWVWVSGSSVTGQAGTYGSLGVADLRNNPGGRDGITGWKDFSGNFWVFGGWGFDRSGTGAELNDLWTFQYFATTPNFDIAAGTYNSAQTVTISDTTPGATIYYTTDSSTPTSASAKYTAAITVSSTETLHAIATASGYSNSAVATAAYSITLPAATPTFSPATGNYTSAQTVTISSSTANATIYYTTDGSTPTTASTKYTAAIAVSSTETLQAIATASGCSTSTVATAYYSINIPIPSITSLSPSSATAGGAAFTLTLNGTNFASEATAQWGTTALTTTYVSATRLTAAVPASLIAAAGSASVTVTTTGGTSSGTTITINAAPITVSFTLTGTAVTVVRGASTGNTSAISITPAGGFTGNVTLTAFIATSRSGAVYLPILSFGSTSPVSIISTTPGVATLTASTTAATSSALVHPQLPGVQGLTAGGAALACLLLFGIPARRRKWRAMLGMVALLAVLVGGIVACGGGSGSTSNNNPSNPGTTAGSYTVTVTGTDTATGKIAASTSVNLTVN